MEEKLYCGIDLHKNFSEMCIMNEVGDILEQRRIYHSAGGFEQFFGKKRRLECVVEPVENWGWAVDVLQALDHGVHLANTYKVRLIAESRMKTDRVDARILADLLRAGYLPEGYVAPMELRDRRTYLRYRINLVRQRVLMKNQIKRLLRVENIQDAGYTDTFGRSGRKWLDGVKLRPVHEKIKQETLGTIDRYDGLIKKLDAEIRDKSKEDEIIRRLMTIPGIGQFTAQVIMAEVGDMSRFPTSKHFAGYVGLVSSERSSGGKIHHGRITKQGNKHIRWLLVEGAKKAKSIDPNLKKFFDRLAYKKGKSKAIIAVARKLAVICWCVVMNNAPYNTNKVCRRFGQARLVTGQ